MDFGEKNKMDLMERQPRRIWDRKQPRYSIRFRNFYKRPFQLGKVEDYDNSILAYNEGENDQIIL
jgi:hypothetical protein